MVSLKLPKKSLAERVQPLLPPHQFPYLKTPAETVAYTFLFGSNSPGGNGGPPFPPGVSGGKRSLSLNASAGAGNTVAVETMHSNKNTAINKRGIGGIFIKLLRYSPPLPFTSVKRRGLLKPFLLSTYIANGRLLTTPGLFSGMFGANTTVMEVLLGRNIIKILKSGSHRVFSRKPGSLEHNGNTFRRFLRKFRAKQKPALAAIPRMDSLSLYLLIAEDFLLALYHPRVLPAGAAR